MFDKNERVNRMKKALTCFVFLLLSQNLWAQDEANTPMKASYAYFGFDPDIVTNYVTPTTEELGYVRVTMELMIMDKKYLEVVEHHEPLILDKIVAAFGRENADTIRSLTGREEIRLKILNQLRDTLKKETGQDILKDVLFTKYLYH
jgi:flagellar protein FliL